MLLQLQENMAKNVGRITKDLSLREAVCRCGLGVCLRIGTFSVTFVDQ